MHKLLPIAVMIFSVPASAHDAHDPQDAQFRGDPTHAGVYPGVGPARLGGVKWKFKTGGAVIASPVVAGARVYVGSSDHFLYALDASTGAVAWKLETGSRIASSPAVVGGVVYVLGYDSTLYAVAAGKGSVKWKFKTGGERRYTATHLHGFEPAAEAMPDPFDVFLSSPAVVNGAVYFGSSDGNVYALDAATGTQRWKFHTGDVVHASPAIADGKVFVGSWDSYFYALDAATGALVWKFKTGEDPKIHNQQGIQASALVIAGVVMFGCRDSMFYALDAATGKRKWTFSNKGSWVVGSAAARDGKVYFATSDSAKLYGFDAKSGSQLFDLDFQKWPMFSSPAIAGTMLYVGSHRGRLLAIDLDLHKVAWSFDTDGEQQNAATYVNADGTPNYDAAFADSFYDDLIVGVTKMMSLGAVLSSPVVANGIVYFGSTDGNVYALE